MCMLQASMGAYKKLLYMILSAPLLASFACSGNNENSHTTVTTHVSPPPHQVLQAETRSGRQLAGARNLSVDVNKPLLVFNLPNGQTFRAGEEVVIDFSLANAKLKGDDGEMQWIDRWEEVALSGWVPVKHTIRLELIGPKGWPVRDNIVTREIMVV